MIVVSEQGKLRGTVVRHKIDFGWGGWKVAPGYVIHAMGDGVDVGIDEWLAERMVYASLKLRECVEVNPKRRGGIPVLEHGSLWGSCLGNLRMEEASLASRKTSNSTCRSLSSSCEGFPYVWTAPQRDDHISV